jgi:hypothetical protein
LLRAIPLLVTLAAPVSAAFAGSHYVEIWNPPEARLAPPGKPARKPAAQKRATRKPATRIARVAEPTRSSPAQAPKAESTVRQPPPVDTIDIPRIVGPDGRPMRVAYKVSA